MMVARVIVEWVIHGSQQDEELFIYSVTSFWFMPTFSLSARLAPDPIAPFTGPSLPTSRNMRDIRKAIAHPYYRASGRGKRASRLL